MDKNPKYYTIGPGAIPVINKAGGRRPNREQLLMGKYV